jgi:hypothetical protein
MRISWPLFTALFIYVISSCNPSHQSKDNAHSLFNSLPVDSLLAGERLKLKKYALCKCLIDKYPQDSFLLRDGSMRGLVETGSYGNQAYETIDSFIQKKSLVTYQSKSKKKLYLMRCIDIYEDPELEMLIKKLDNESSVGK